MSKPRHLGYILVSETDGTLIEYQRIFGRKNDAETTGRHLLNCCGVKSKVLEVHTRDQGDAAERDVRVFGDACSVCGSRRIVSPEGKQLACSFIDCPAPLADHDKEGQ